jgi:hypothetical protein
MKDKDSKGSAKGIAKGTVGTPYIHQADYSATGAAPWGYPNLSWQPGAGKGSGAGPTPEMAVSLRDPPAGSTRTSPDVLCGCGTWNPTHLIEDGSGRSSWACGVCLTVASGTIEEVEAALGGRRGRQDPTTGPPTAASAAAAAAIAGYPVVPAGPSATDAGGSATSAWPWPPTEALPPPLEVPPFAVGWLEPAGAWAGYRCPLCGTPIHRRSWHGAKARAEPDWSSWSLVLFSQAAGAGPPLPVAGPPRRTLRGHMLGHQMRRDGRARQPRALVSDGGAAPPPCRVAVRWSLATGH